jgi:hypothetical protein
MKLRFLFGFVLSLCLSGVVLAQSATRIAPSESPQFSARAASFSGTVSDDARFFVADPDSQVWAVTNPELLKTHQGQRVLLQAQTASGTKSIRVLSAKPTAGEVRIYAQQNDSAFRR